MISRALGLSLAVLSVTWFWAIALPTSADVEMSERSAEGRTTIRTISAVITEIDVDAREVTIEGGLGNALTLTVGPEVTRFSEFKVGDLVVATYAASISGELRAPTEAELAQPLVELDAAAIASANMDPGALVGRAVRAVCTIEGMNRITRTVMLRDADGDFHIIDDVDPARMEGVALGDTVIVTYSEAFALTLEKQAPAE